MVRHSVSRAIPVAILSLVTSCEIASTTVARTDPQVVVHAVFNATQRVQLVLVEQSLTGAQAVVDSGPYNPANPIVSGNGIPIGGAVVQLTTPSGTVMTAAESRSGGGTTGIYSFDLTTELGATGTYLRMGERYSLSVLTNGKVVTGTTVIPSAPPFTGTVPTGSFNRDHDSVTMTPRDVQLSRAFWVRVEAPVSPYSLLTFDQQLNLSGEARNLYTQELVRLFVPGFLQTVTIAAIDSNVYDYYRSGSDPFSGAGLISRLQGGLGLFGSVVVIDRRVLDVTQDATGDPFEGTYTLRSGFFSQTMPRQMRLYVEAKGPTAEADDRISGNYVSGPPSNAFRGGILGFRAGSSLELQILESQSASRITAVFRAVARGDTLRGTLTGGIAAVYVKQGK